MICSDWHNVRKVDELLGDLCGNLISLCEKKEERIHLPTAKS